MSDAARILPPIHDKPDGAEQLIKARTDALYATTLPAAAMSFVGSIIVAAAFWAPRERAFAVTLMVATAALLCARILLLAAYRMMDPPRSIHWAWAATGFTTVAGVLWGGAIIWAIQVGSADQVLVITCIALGAVLMAVPNVSFWPAYAGFEIAVTGLAAIGFCASDQPGRLQIGIASGLLCIALAIAGRNLGERVIQAMRLAVDNEALTQRLRTEASALEKANRELEILSHTDALTGLANRRWFTIVLEREWARATRTGAPLAVLAIDIDYFKRYNDTHGHAAGDACLQVVAMALEASIRLGMDVAARPGGEEFALLLPITSIEDAMVVAERVRLGTMAMTGSPENGLLSPATISIGVAASLPIKGGTPQSLLEDADRALYLSKSLGRNRVSPASGPEGGPD